jgi:hypothetical protein
MARLESGISELRVILQAASSSVADRRVNDETDDGNDMAAADRTPDGRVAQVRAIFK